MSRSDEPSVLHAEPQAFVTDVAAAIAFYVRSLGFELVMAYGEPTFYAQVRRGGARLNLRLVRGPVFAPDFVVAEPDPLVATIAVEGIGRLFSAYEREGVELHQPLRGEPWGALTFIVRDPSGNLVAFAGDPS